MAAKKRRKHSAAKEPWERSAPRRTRHTKLSGGDKAVAKKRARKAGRPYPNLVDNMAVAAKKSGRKKSASTSGRSTRLARTAQAWGELIPKTVAAARRLAATGRRLLERYRRQRA